MATKTISSFSIEIVERDNKCRFIVSTNRGNTTDTLKPLIVSTFSFSEEADALRYATKKIDLYSVDCYPNHLLTIIHFLVDGEKEVFTLQCSRKNSGCWDGIVRQGDLAMCANDAPSYIQEFLPIEKSGKIFKVKDFSSNFQMLVIAKNSAEAEEKAIKKEPHKFVKPIAFLLAVLGESYNIEE